MRAALDVAATPAEQERAALSLGDALVRLGDRAGARAAYDVGLPLGIKRMTTVAGLPDVRIPVAPIARVRIAINRRPRTRRAMARLNDIVPLPPGVSKRPPYRDG